MWRNHYFSRTLQGVKMAEAVENFTAAIIFSIHTATIELP